MREQESILIHELLNMPELGLIRTVVEIGSSNQEFRMWQSHIGRNIHDPLRLRGVHIVTTDLKEGEGIEVSGDILDPAIQSRLKSMAPDVILCCNVLEHIENPQAVADACCEIQPAGGFIVVTVPFSYPYHPDPIDTMFRPLPDEIVSLFPRYRTVRSEIIETGNLLSDLKRLNDPVLRALLRTLVRSVWPWSGLGQVKARWHRWLWLREPYQQSVVLLKRDASA